MKRSETDVMVMMEYIKEEKRQAIVGDWARPSFGLSALSSARPRIKLCREDKRCGIRGQLEIRLRTEIDEDPLMSREYQFGMRQNFKAVFEAGLRR